MTAVYLERYANYGLTREELQSGRPIIGIAQTGSDLSPCNRIHLDLQDRIRDGIRDGGGVPFVFPVHPIFENCRSIGVGSSAARTGMANLSDIAVDSIGSILRAVIRTESASYQGA